MDDYVHQYGGLKPRRLRKSLEDNGINQNTLVVLSDEVPGGGISGGSLSQYLSEQRPALSLRAQVAIHRVLEFFEEQRERANGVPVDFNNIPAMRKLFREFLRARSRAEVIKTEREAAQTASAEKA